KSTSTATINVLNTPDAGIAATPLQFCAGEVQNVTLATLLVGADPGGIWVETSQTPSTGGAFNATTGRFNTTGQIPGIYHFDYILVGPGPCPDDVVTVEVVIEDNPVADAGNTATLNCITPTTVLGGSGSSTGPQFEYSWVATNGGVVTPDDVLNPIASAGGTYTLTVLNTITGCSATDDVTIDQVGAFPSDIDIKVQSPDCVGDPAGSATVNAVIGGTPPFTYSLNNGPSVNSGVFPGLTTGDYILEVTDASGCTLTESFTIEDLVIVDLSIVNYVNDTLIFDRGDTIKLSYIFEGTNDIPDSVIWKMGDIILCINCNVLEITADLSGQITLEAYDVRGCRIEKAISFLVIRERDVYIPNIFSPNGDDLNDYFTLFTDADLKEITVMEIYTRWGELVFKKSAVQPNDPKEGWDGTFRGKTMNPGVYVYRIEIEHGDGLKENLAGDVTIVR
ncbi:MAG: gliding motility-associated C-terminal domain-containing protein, partial [Saprospiraceae bacterium]